jgi:cytochrome c-type biogenesis protein CcmH
MRRLALIALLLTLIAPGVALAVDPEEILKDPVLEQRARDLSSELRCMVCQNQSIDDSNAPLARDLRVIVRERLSAGDSDSQVLDYLVARYGEFVLLRPRFHVQTLLLWGAPPLALIAGLIALWMAARRRQTVNLSALELSAAERKKIATLVQPDNP